MKDEGFRRLRIGVVSAGTVLAGLFAAVTRTARASTNLPVAYTSATRWRVQSSDCAASLGAAGRDCGLGVRQFAGNTATAAPTSDNPPPTTVLAPPTTSDPTSTTTTTTAPGDTPTTSITTTSLTTDALAQGGSIAGQAKPRGKADTGNQTIAFNHSLGLAVENKVFKAPGGKIDLIGNTVSAGPQTIAGLAVNVQYQFVGPTRSVRAVFTFNNPTATPITARFNTNLGAPAGGGALLATSTGKNVATPANRWFATAGAKAAKSVSATPPIVFVAYASNARPMLYSASDIAFSGGVVDFVASYKISVSPGDTVGIMVFAQAATGTPTAATVDATFANLSTLAAANMLSNLPIAQNKLLNWNGPVRTFRRQGPGVRPK